MKNYTRYYDWVDDFVDLSESAQIDKVNALFDSLRDLRKAVQDKITAYAQAAAATGLDWTDPTLAELETEYKKPIDDAATGFYNEATTI